MGAPLFPMFLKLAGRQSLVVGAGSVGNAKTASLLHAGARVTVVAPHAAEPVRRLALQQTITWIAREFRGADLAGMFLVIAATSDPSVNRAVFLEAQARGVLCNSVDDPPHCDFYFPSVLRRGDLQIAVSTAGQSPALAQRVRRELEEQFDDATSNWVKQLGELRREIIATQPPSEERKNLLLKLAYTEREALARQKTKLASPEPLAELQVREAEP